MLRAIGVEAEKPFTLGGLNQMVFGLRNWCPPRRRDREVLATVFGADAATQSTPIALTVAVLNLLSAAAQDRPVLLVVDDVHWLDDVSATVLNAVGRRVRISGCASWPPTVPTQALLLRCRVGPS